MDSNMKMAKRKTSFWMIAIVAAIAAFALALAGCAGNTGGSGSSSSQKDTSGNPAKADTYVIVEATASIGDTSIMQEFTRNGHGDATETRTYVDGVLTTIEEYDYDSAGIPTQVAVTSYDFDDYVTGQQTVEAEAVVGADGLPSRIVWNYDAMEYTDGRSEAAQTHTFDYTYKDGRIATEKNTIRTDLNGGRYSDNESTYSYDERGLVQSVMQDIGLYDKDGNPESIIIADTATNTVSDSSDKTIDYIYSDSGNKVTITVGDAAITLTLVFDENGNVSEVQDEDGNAVFTYKWEKIESPSDFIAATGGTVGEDWHNALSAANSTGTFYFPSDDNADGVEVRIVTQ